MVFHLSLLLLAFAVSLDSFGVGVTYGMRQVKIPLRSILIIALCSATMIFIATGVAQGFLLFLSPGAAEVLGGIILLGLGCWAIFNLLRHKNGSSEDKAVPDHTDRSLRTHTDQDDRTRFRHDDRVPGKHIWTIELRKLGIAIQILRTPLAADMDRSGRISGMEALILGLALSLDAFGAGIGAAMIGYSPYVAAALIGCMSSLFVYLGMRFGMVFARTGWLSKLSYLPGFILILFGLYKIL